MNWNEYLPLAEKTLSDQFHCQNELDQKILHAVIGSLTEIEELLDNYDQQGNLSTNTYQQGSIAEESADIFWYLSILYRELKIGERVITIDNDQPFSVLITYLKVNLKLLDMLKKKIYYNKAIDQEMMIQLATQMYSLLIHFCQLYDTDVNVILEKNINKLKSRYGDKFSSERAINRDLESERKILEN